MSLFAALDKLGAAVTAKPQSGARARYIKTGDHPRPGVQTFKDECRAYQCNDMMYCPCGLQYDVNDPDPPICPKDGKPARACGAPA